MLPKALAREGRCGRLSDTSTERENGSAGAHRISSTAENGDRLEDQKGFKRRVLSPKHFPLENRSPQSRTFSPKAPAREAALPAAKRSEANYHGAPKLKDPGARIAISDSAQQNGQTLKGSFYAASTRVGAFCSIFEIYKIGIPLHRSNLKMSIKFHQTFSDI